jgi:hypothetical protein
MLNGSRRFEVALFACLVASSRDGSYSYSYLYSMRTRFFRARVSLHGVRVRLRQQQKQRTFKVPMGCRRTIACTKSNGSNASRSLDNRESDCGWGPLSERAPSLCVIQERAKSGGRWRFKLDPADEDGLSCLFATGRSPRRAEAVRCVLGWTRAGSSVAASAYQYASKTMDGGWDDQRQCVLVKGKR